MKNKHLTLLMIVLWSVFSCAQQNKDINATNVVEYMAAQVKTYDKHPMYAIRPVQNSCIYEILINDFPIYSNYNLQKLATPIEINSAILKSGPQTITYRLYPLGDLMVDTYGKGETINTLLKNTSMNIEVIKYEDVKTGTGIDDELLVTQHESLTKNGTREFIGCGLPYYEYTFSFEAKVPYVNEGWSNGQDLTKFDKEELENIVSQKYLQIKKLYLEKNIDKLIHLEYLEQSLRQDISDYKDKETIKEYWNNYYTVVNKNNKRFQSLEGCEMQFFGNNRIVTFRHSVMSPPDPRLAGESALYFLTTLESGRIIANFNTLLLYLPKGKPLTVQNLQLL